MTLVTHPHTSGVGRAVRRYTDISAHSATICIVKARVQLNLNSGPRSEQGRVKIERALTSSA
jgi:hypothetical protein